jgi:hypothetical protein
VDLADLAGGQADLRPVAVLRHELRRDAGGADELTALALLELDVVDRGAERDVPQRQELPGLMSALRLDTMVSPTLRPSGARM